MPTPIPTVRAAALGLVDGASGLENVAGVGEADRTAADGAIPGTRGGKDPAKITDETCYEANIFDQCPDPTFGTGAIVKVARAPDPMPRAGGKWNTDEITARGSRLVLVLNGTKTVEVDDTKFASGPLALQWGRGTVKFRKVEIRPL